MQILGKYPKGHGKPIRVNVTFLKIRDRLLIDFESYFVIETFPGNAILLDRPLERAIEFNETISLEQIQ